MSSNSLIEQLNAELRAASPDLVDNGDLLRGILSGCGDCIKVLDLDGRLQFMSEGGKRVMEVDDFSALKGCPWPEFWAGDGNIQAHAAVAAARGGGIGRFRGGANTAKGNPRYWDVQVSPIMGPDGKPSHLLSISRDITEEWEAAERQRESAERQRFLTDELQHRVKNTLATVIAIASQTFRGEPHQGPLQAFNARLRILNQVHDVLTQSNWAKTPILRIVEGALAPHRTGEGRIRVSGPDFGSGFQAGAGVGAGAQ